LGSRDTINAELPIYQERNKTSGIGGMILSHEHFFLQIIEGERDKVNDIYRRIVCDKRHENVTLVRYNDIRQAEFTSWNFAVIDNDEQCKNYDCIEFLANLIPDTTKVAKDISSATAMSILRKAAAVAIVTRAPNRRKTDLANIFTYESKKVSDIG
jgi:hypothetical protein